MPDSPSTTPQRQQPVHEIRLGAIKAAIWKNETENGPRFNSTFSRIYRNGDEWKSTDSFGTVHLEVVGENWADTDGAAGARTCSPQRVESVSRVGTFEPRRRRKPLRVENPRSAPTT